MKAQIEWIEEAIDLLSEGFSRKEAIRHLIKDGCHPKQAITTVDELIEDSRNYGKHLAKQGMFMLFATSLFAFVSLYTESFAFPELIMLGSAAGLFYLARGCTRIMSI